MNPVTIRDAVSSDIEQLSRLFVELDDHHMRQRPEEFLALKGPARSFQHISEMLCSPQSVVIVAEEPGRQIVGLTHILIRAFPITLVAPSRIVAEMDSLVVRGDRRRQGIGGALVNAALSWAADQSVASLEVSFRGFNRDGDAFYRQAGFELMSCRMRLPVSQ